MINFHLHVFIRIMYTIFNPEPESENIVTLKLNQCMFCNLGPLLALCQNTKQNFTVFVFPAVIGNQMNWSY